MLYKYIWYASLLSVFSITNLLHQKLEKKCGKQNQTKPNQKDQTKQKWSSESYQKRIKGWHGTCNFYTANSFLSFGILTCKEHIYNS